MNEMNELEQKIKTTRTKLVGIMKNQDRAITVAELKRFKVFDEDYKTTLEELSKLYSESGRKEYQSLIGLMQGEISAINEARYNYFNGRGLFGESVVD